VPSIVIPRPESGQLALLVYGDILVNGLCERITSHQWCKGRIAFGSNLRSSSSREFQGIEIIKLNKGVLLIVCNYKQKELYFSFQRGWIFGFTIAYFFLVQFVFGL
jgi:hypothetical protein